MLKITQAPPQSVALNEQFSIKGVASQDYAGLNLNLVVDNQFRTTGPLIDMDGTWEVKFVFRQPGNRQLRIAIANETLDLTVVVAAATPPPPPPTPTPPPIPTPPPTPTPLPTPPLPRIRIDTLPPAIQAGQAFTILGSADNYLNGSQLRLLIDKFELARPTVQTGKWQSSITVQNPGKRALEITGAGQDRAQTVIDVLAPVPIVRRLTFTNPPTRITSGQSVTFMGEAIGYADGDTLVLNVDRFELGRPQVQASKWQVALTIRNVGRRTVELVGTGQDRIQAAVDVVAAPPPPVATRRLDFTTPPAQLPVGQARTLTGLATGYTDGTVLSLQVDGVEVARPPVTAGKWQADLVLRTAGKRAIALVGTAPDRAEVVIEATPAVRPPRLRFTSVPQRVESEASFTVSGQADLYANGDQLALMVDQIVAAHPKVQDGAWQAAITIRNAGKRTVEIIGSEQDRAQTTIEVIATGLKVIPRSEWTTETTPADLPNLQPRGITLHHTSISPNPATTASAAAEFDRMRSILRTHVQSNGWSDIGYHFIIMPSGRIYEARLERKRGAHDVINDGLGIAFDGVYSTVNISPQQFQSAVTLCTVLCQRYGIGDPTVLMSTPTADFGTRNLPRIMGHRDRVATECPGSPEGRTVRLNDVRQAVKAQLAR